MKIPNFLKHQGVGNIHSLKLCKIKSSNPDILLRVTDEESFTATVTNGDQGSKKYTLVYIYQDEFYMTLLGVCKIQI